MRQASSPEDGLPVLRTERLVLRIAKMGEEGKVVRYLRRNRDHLAPWEPLRDEAYFRDETWEHGPAVEISRARDEVEYRFRILDASGAGEYLGTVSLRDITRWPTYTGTIGYSLDASACGKGITTEAVGAVLEFAFGDLGLHRIEACTMPRNAASQRVLEKLGFEREGLLRKSLMIAGEWEDHLLYAKVAEAWVEGDRR